MKNTLLSTYSTNILVRLLTVNMKKCLTPKIRKMCDPILVTLLKMRPIVVNPVVKKNTLHSEKLTVTLSALLLLSYDVSEISTSNETFVKKQNQYFYLMVTQFNNPIPINKIISQIMTRKAPLKKKKT